MQTWRAPDEVQVALPGTHTRPAQRPVEETHVPPLPQGVETVLSPSAAQACDVVASRHDVRPGVQTHGRQVPDEQVSIAAQLVVV